MHKQILSAYPHKHFVFLIPKLLLNVSSRVSGIAKIQGLTPELIVIFIGDGPNYAR